MKNFNKLGESGNTERETEKDEFQYDSKEEARQEAIYHSSEIKDSEFSFAKRLMKLEETEEKMSEKELERWEDILAGEYKRMEENLELGEIHGTEARTEVLQHMVAYPGEGKEKDLRNTIEARSGDFFYERREALKKAVDNPGVDKKKKSEVNDLLNKFVSVVYEHIDLKYIDKQDIREQYGDDGHMYEYTRRTIHNNAIKYLNELNNLAKELNVRPFTPRNFLPSDLVDEKHQTGAEKIVFRYDRDIVEEYYAFAFPSATRKAQAIADQKQRFGIY